MLQQVPETLIATAIGTAMLPTISALAASDHVQDFHSTIERAIRVLTALTLPVAVVLGIGLGPLLETVFGFGQQGTQVLLWTTRGFLAGLVGHSLMEIASRSFYARKDAITPMLTGGLNLIAYIILGLLLYQPLGPAGISLTDAICFTFQAILLLTILARRLGKPFESKGVLMRASLAGLAGGVVTFAIQLLPMAQKSPLIFGVLSMALGMLLVIPFIWTELRLLLHL